MESPPATDGPLGGRRPGRPFVAVYGVVIGGALVTAAVTTSADRWNVPQLAVILTLAVLGDLLSVQVKRVHVSGIDVGIMLALVLQGPAAAMVVALISIAAGWFKHREKWHAFLSNLTVFSWAPLVGGLFFHAAVRVTHLSLGDAWVYPLVFATFLLLVILNVLGVAAYEDYMRRTAFVQFGRQMLQLLPAHLAQGVLIMGGIFIAVQTGTVGILLMGSTLAIFQYLVGELLKSKQRGDDLKRLATIDTLTGLVNRDQFRTELDRKIAEASAANRSIAVMLIDLDRFKEINDTLGHHYGDVLLQEIAPRLAKVAGPDGLVARLGGDEFAVVPAACATDIETIEVVAKQVIACAQEGIVVEEIALDIGASIGIAMYPGNGADANTLLRCADVAMYTAKEAHTGWKFYEQQLDPNSVRKLSVLSDFRRALTTDEIAVYYQPIVDVQDACVRGAEALVRWQHPDFGLLSPAAFMDTVERTGLIGPLTSLVLERAVEQCAQWRRSGWRLSVAVNLSVRNLLDQSLPNEVERLLAKYRLPPEALKLEITESMLMSDPERVLATVNSLNSLGVRLSVDDFGTGYSSLATLRQVPIKELKIDRSFVSPMLQVESDLIIVRSTINLGHDLGLHVIAEGVEDAETLTRLAKLGCDLAQGYHLSRPMPADQFTRWLEEDATPERLALVI